MPKEKKNTPEEKKGIFRRVFDMLPKGVQNFIRTVRDVAVSLTNRVIFGNKQSERLRRADVDEILRKEKLEAEMNQKTETPEKEIKKDPEKEAEKQEIKDSIETQMNLAGFAGAKDVQELSDRLTEAGIAHTLSESAEFPQIICRNPINDQIAKIDIIRAEMNEEGQFISKRTGENINDVAMQGKTDNSALYEFNVYDKDANYLGTRYASADLIYKTLDIVNEKTKEKDLEKDKQVERAEEKGPGEKETKEKEPEQKDQEEITGVQEDEFAKAQAEASAQVNTIIVYNAQAYNKALDNAKKTGQSVDVKLADTAFVVEVRNGKVQGKEPQFKAKNEKTEKQFKDVIRSKCHTFVEGKENSIALAHNELQIDMKRDANVAFVEVTKGDRTKTVTVTSNESPEQLYEKVQGAVKDIDKAPEMDEPDFFENEIVPENNARKTLDELIEDAEMQINEEEYMYVEPDMPELDENEYMDPRYY